ncbi:hypothetical protein [Coraliomargarita akajimensis]|uniref:Uncharacterized protein n=1 Tax=Coraliomargarita akajimensis (strain DSM 45221 / IAM 15411 / JCM 23193 / KCTC 12865 / 04OKA010-24) TaxID=583355 RepID=D5EI69_CORAD|nr:hypothetical protein [Coraliomargarita akajimensis]ADE56109.1 hypothetical protein Caka_3096 [Coraliomargarita akajimensis DSM 45221]
MVPVLLVVLTFLVSTTLNIIYWYNDQEPNPYIDGILFGVLAAVWVKLDSAKRNIFFPTDWVLFFALIYYPIYVFQTRGWKGVYTLLILIGLFSSFSTLEYAIESLIYITVFDGDISEVYP